MSTLHWKDRCAHHLPWREVALVAFALLSGTLSAAALRAQDVAEAARQARERRAAEQKSGQYHVYTEEDLKRAKILTLEDDTPVASRKATPPGQEKKNDEPQVAEKKKEGQQPADQKADAQTLGEVARRYRQEKAERQAPPRFPLDVRSNTLAAPKPLVDPGKGSLHEDELKPVPRTLAPAPRNNFPFRISPLAPRSAVVPRNPAAEVPLGVIAGSVQRRQVQPGDSWWKLASRYLGKGSRWEELLRVNPGLDRDPNKLRAGTFVFVPGSVHPRAAPPGAQIVVHKGDTLWSLAREHLGSGQRWTELAAANPEVTQFKKLQLGRKVNLPGKGKSPESSRPAPQD